MDTRAQIYSSAHFTYSVHFYVYCSMMMRPGWWFWSLLRSLLSQRGKRKRSAFPTHISSNVFNILNTSTWQPLYSLSSLHCSEERPFNRIGVYHSISQCWCANTIVIQLPQPREAGCDQITLLLDMVSYKLKTDLKTNSGFISQPIYEIIPTLDVANVSGSGSKNGLEGFTWATASLAMSNE